MGLIEVKATVSNQLGLHARPAAELVKIAHRFESEIQIAKDGMWVNAKSILGVMTLAAERGSELSIKAEGPDADAAVAAIAELIGRDWKLTDV
jgi:phosphotransferase system HPr (HPr) family protein